MMKGLTENECGGQNALMKLTSHLTANSDHVRIQDTQRSRHTGSSAADALVSEYLGIDQTVPIQHQQQARPGPIRQQQARSFHMEKLLSELKQIDTESHKFNVPAVLPGSDSWSQEYFSLNPSMSGAGHNNNMSLNLDGPSAFKWSTEYLTQSEATIFDEAWGNLINSSLSHVDSLAQRPSLLSPENGHKAAAENSATNSQLNDEMRKTANELLDSMQDSRFSETEVRTDESVKKKWGRNSTLDSM